MRWKERHALLDCSGGEARKRSRSSPRPATFRWRSKATGIPDMATGSLGIRAKRRSPDAGRGPSGRTSAECSAQGRPGTILPAPFLAPHMEPTEPENFLDPSVWRFRQPLPRGVGGPALRRRQVFPHPVRGGPPVAVDGGVLPAFPAQRHMASDSPCLHRGEIRFVAVASVRKHLRRHPPARCRGRVHYGQQLPLIRRPPGQPPWQRSSGSSRPLQPARWCTAGTLRCWPS